MKTREPHINTFIQGLNSEHYQLKNQPITGTWNNAGDEILAKMHRRQVRIERIKTLKSVAFGLGLFGLGALVFWLM
tara:strand:+ start:2066 stop:2293 length:228 start_codon:yes stop_codon:yes gene_type:complete